MADIPPGQNQALRVERATRASPAAQISIITPTLNCAAFIAQALASRKQQGAVDSEQIVIDGGSSDGTIAIVQADRQTRLIVKPSLGLYASLNLGIAEASGSIIGFLNGDDLLEASTLAWVAEQFAANPEVLIVSGHATTFADPDRPAAATRTAVQPSTALDWQRVLFGVPAINARFFRREVFETVGRFSHDYRIAADREFLIRVLRAGLPELASPRTVYHYRVHAGSLTLNPHFRHVREFATEHMRIARGLEEAGDLERTSGALVRLWAEESLVTALVAALRNREFGACFTLLRASPRRAALPFALARAITRKLVRRWRHRQT